MRRTLLFVSFLMIVVASSVHAQSIGVGLRDNCFTYAFIRNKTGGLIGYEQSILNVDLKEQYGRIFAGFGLDKSNWSVYGIAYCGTEYSGEWHIYGVSVNSAYRFRCFKLDAVLNPHYDSGMDFTLCYNGEVGIAFWQSQERKEMLEFCASYGNLPEFRMAENKIQLGLKVSCENLWIKSMICIPNSNKGYGQKYLRLLCSFGWSL